MREKESIVPQYFYECSFDSVNPQGSQGPPPPQEPLGHTLRTTMLGLEIQTWETQCLAPPSARGKTQRIFTAQYSTTYCSRDRDGAMGAQGKRCNSVWVCPHGWRESEYFPESVVPDLS